MRFFRIFRNEEIGKKSRPEFNLFLQSAITYRGLKVLAEVGLPVSYKEVAINLGYRLDLLVEESVIVELKAVTELAPIHKAQLFTYMKLANKPLGLLLNFRTPDLRRFFDRIIY